MAGKEKRRLALSAIPQRKRTELARSFVEGEGSLDELLDVFHEAIVEAGGEEEIDRGDAHWMAANQAGGKLSRVTDHAARIASGDAKESVALSDIAHERRVELVAHLVEGRGGVDDFLAVFRRAIVEIGGGRGGHDENMGACVAADQLLRTPGEGLGATLARIDEIAFRSDEGVDPK